MRNVMLVVEYEGTRYHGFQVQKGMSTIQGELEKAVYRLTGEVCRVMGASRTDAGVHASGQVVNFKTNSELPTAVLRRALNSLLPADIVVKEAAYVPPDFHARYSAKSREYRYTILNREAPSALERHLLYHFRAPLDMAAMQRACQLLVGSHDFTPFSGTKRKSSTRRVERAACHQENDKIYIEVVANAFLPHMMRGLVGALLQIGAGKWEMGDFQRLLDGETAPCPVPSSPARGLCLTRVYY